MLTSLIALAASLLFVAALVLAGRIRHGLAARKALTRFRCTAIPGHLARRRSTEQTEDLPPVVESYLKRALPKDAANCQQAQITQSGAMRLARGKRWMPLRADQLISVHPRSFVWRARVRAAPGVSLHALDTFDGYHGEFSASLFGLFEVAGARGPETDFSSLHRYLAEAVWLPSALLPSGALRWKATADPNMVRAVLHTEGRTVSGMFIFDDQARPVEFVTEKRYRYVDGAMVRTPWRVQYADHERIADIEIPRTGTASWLLSDGTLEVVRLTIDDLVLR